MPMLRMQTMHQALDRQPAQQAIVLQRAHRQRVHAFIAGIGEQHFGPTVCILDPAGHQLLPETTTFLQPRLQQPGRSPIDTGM
ncbi:hypothetical protein D3C73_1494820 [compost metagenome]